MLMLILTAIVITWVGLILACSAKFIRSIYGKHNLLKHQNMILITGCDSGFGLMTALQLTKMGFFVVGTVITKEGYESLKDKIGLVIQSDVTNQSDIDKLTKIIEKTLKERGLQFWALINNAGIGDGSYMDITPLKSYEKVMDVNYFGIVRVTKAVLPFLKGTKYSRVINLSSMAGHLASGSIGPYCATKHAVEGLAKAMRFEFRHHNIHVCNINPAFMRTPIITKSKNRIAEMFNEVPLHIREQYDPEFFESEASTAEATAEDPQLVVDEIIEVITDRYPIFNHYVGYGALILRIVCMLPYPMQELFGNPLNPSPLKKKT